MDFSQFSGCCKAEILYDFGGGESTDKKEDYTKKSIIKWVKKKLTRMKKDGTALVFAVATSTQPNAVAALEELGFYGHPKPKKCHGNNEDHKVMPFFLNLSEWDEEKFDSRYNPDTDQYKDRPNRRLSPARQNKWYYY